jgi:hypothetical protein
VIAAKIREFALFAGNALEKTRELFLTTDGIEIGLLIAEG